MCVLVLQQFLSTLCDEFKLPLPPASDTEKEMTVQWSSTQLHFKKLSAGLAMRAHITTCPVDQREELFLHLMQANFLAQATGGATIGLDAEEKFLTLSLGVPYELSYRTFKERLELFLNYLDYWRKEIEKLKA